MVEARCVTGSIHVIECVFERKCFCYHHTHLILRVLLFVLCNSVGCLLTIYWQESHWNVFSFMFNSGVNNSAVRNDKWKTNTYTFAFLRTFIVKNESQPNGMPEHCVSHNHSCVYFYVYEFVKSYNLLRNKYQKVMILPNTNLMYIHFARFFKQIN